jgi:hypothetical protein
MATRYRRLCLYRGASRRRLSLDRHRANILEKLGMRNRVEVTRYAIKRGLVEP